MSIPQFEIQLIAVLVALACAIPGVFLVLRKMAMISDAISHAILPGIVLGFFLTEDISSPLLLIMAALTGVLTVVLVELIHKTGLVKEDTAIGLVFPALFSVGVLLIAKAAGDIHLDIDVVLVGELAFAPFDRLNWGGVDMGPKALWVMATVLLINGGLLLLFFKSLKLASFDKLLAASLGFSPAVLHFGLMSVTSLTTVAAFDAVGAILVVALMIVPAATAYLLSKRVKYMLLWAMLFGALSAIGGYWLAHWVDGSIAGAMATCLGFIFFLVFLFARKGGVLRKILEQQRRKDEFALLAILEYIQPSEMSSKQSLQTNLYYSEQRIEKLLTKAAQRKWIQRFGENYQLTAMGKRYREDAMAYIHNRRAEPPLAVNYKKE